MIHITNNLNKGNMCSCELKKLHHNSKLKSQEESFTFVIPTLGRLKTEGYFEFQASLGYTSDPVSTTTKELYTHTFKKRATKRKKKPSPQQKS